MKTKYFFVLLLCLLVSNFGCEKEKSPTGPSDEIPGNLFPIQLGRQMIFDAFETDTAGNLMPGRTGKSIMRVDSSFVLAGKQCYELVDSTIIADNVEVTKNYFHLDAKGNLWQYLFPNIYFPGPEYIGLKVNVSQYSDSGWLKIFNREIGLNQVHVVLDTTILMGEIQIRYKILSVLKSKTSLTVPLGAFDEVYPGELEFQISSGLFSTSYKFYVWLVPGVGFIKFKEPILSSFGPFVIGYTVKELRSKNF